MFGNTDESISDYFPSMISENPKKIVSLIIIFTLVMGYFASHMEMDTREESFEPQTDKGLWLNEIRRDFGRTGEAIQIAFVADQENVFTTDVMEDMLNTKEAVTQSEKINQTLMFTDEIPEGMATLADTVLTAEVALELEDLLIEQSDGISDISASIENYSAMYSSMDSSLENTSYMVSTEVQEDTTMMLESMSNIMSTPETWGALRSYRTDFANLTEALSADPPDIQEIDTNVTKLIGDMEEDTTLGTEREYFIGLLDGMRNNTINILTDENIPDELYTHNVLSFLNFIEIGQYIPYLDIDLNFETDTPSLELDLEEKKSRLENTTDDEIKKTVIDTIHHDPYPIENSTDRAMDNLDDIDEDSGSTIDHLESSNQTLTDLIEFYTDEGEFEVVQSLEGYKRTVIENKTLLEHYQQIFESMRSNINSARFIPGVIDQLGSAIIRTVSADFDARQTDIGGIQAKSTISLIQMNSSLDRDIRRRAQREIITLSEENSRSSTPRVFAQQIMIEEIEDSSNRSMNTLLPIAFIFVVIVLFIVYRTAVETVLSLLSLFFAIIWTFGFGVILGYEFNPMIIAVPILITGLVIDYGIHMVMRYREEKEKSEKNSLSTKIAISTVGGALLLTSLTTAIGFLSNTFSNLDAMAQFGILAAVGITSSFILMVAFLPSVILLVENWRDNRTDDDKKVSSRGLVRKKSGFITSLLSKSTDASDRHPWMVLLVVILITFSGFYGLINIDTTFQMEDFLPEGSSQSQNIRYIGDNFDISTSYVYIMSEGDLTDPSYLEAVDRTIDNARDSEMVRVEEGVTSPLTVIRDYGMAVEGSANYDPDIVENFTRSNIPENLQGWDEIDEGDISREDVSRLYDLLYDKEISRRAISNVLHREDDSYYSKGVIRFRENARKINEDLNNAKIMDQELDEDSRPLREADYTTKVTSNAIIGQQTTEELTNTQRDSLIATIIVVALLLTIVFYYIHGSRVLGIITTLPVAMVTIWIIGTMYFTGVSLNVMTVSITALTVGMGVDYSIHITHRFTEEKEEEDDLYDAMHDTVQNTGAALFGSAATTVGAFAILATSEILPLSQFGYITALAIAYSFLVAVFVLPAALMIWAKCCSSEKDREED